jgi:hypothetical protein
VPGLQVEIKTIVDKLAGIAPVLQDADPDDKAEVFRQLSPVLTPPPAPTASRSPDRGSPALVFRPCPRSGSGSQLTHMIPIALTTEFALDGGAP